MAEKVFLLIGKIIGVHGIKGELKIFSYAESPAIFQKGNALWIQPSANGGDRYTIEGSRVKGRSLLLSLNGITDRAAAEALVGHALHVEKASLPEPEEGEYFWVDLIGLDVVSTDGRHLGRLKSIMPTGSNDVYVVFDDTTRKEILIPALQSVIMDIDLVQNKMTVALPEGLE